MYLHTRCERGFRALGVSAARRPWTFALVPLGVGLTAVVLALLKVLLTHRITILEDIIYLYTPYKGITHHDRKMIESIYPMNTSDDFETSFLKEIRYVGAIFVRAKDNGTLFRRPIFDELDELNDYIQSLQVIIDGKAYNYTHICSLVKDGKCTLPGYSFLNSRVEALSAGRYRVPYPYYLDIGKMRLEFFGHMLGEVKQDGQGFVRSAKKMMIIYYLDFMKYENISKLWEDAFIKGMQEWKATKEPLANITVDFLTAHSIQKEFRKNILAMFPYIVPSVIMMVFFGWLTCGLDDWVRAKPWLGVVGCLCSLFSVAVAFSICLLLGTPYVEMNMFISFLILGIGMDDTFMLITSWRQTDPNWSISERMSDCFSHVGMSITITSLTNIIAFVIGTITPFPAVFYFCIYISVSLLVCFVNQITLFAGVMALFGQLETNNKHSVFIWVTVVPESEASHRNWLYRFLFTRKSDPTTSKSVNTRWVNKFFEKYVGGMITKRGVMIAILSIYVVYVGFSINGLGRIKEEFKFEKLVRTDSYAYQSFRSFSYDFTHYKFLLEIVRNGTADYSDPKVQKEIEDMLGRFEELPYMSSSSFTWSWLKAYKKFQKDPRTKHLLYGFNTTEKTDFIRGLRDVFFRFPLGKMFRKDVKFTANYTDIRATRYFVIVKHFKNREQTKDLFSKVQEIKKKANFPLSVYNQIFYLFEQFTILKHNLFQAIALATTVVLLTVFLLTPSMTCCLCVSFGILSIEMGVVGIMTYWQIDLDVIVMICLVMCIGLSVDYVAHVTYVYTTSPLEDPDEKIRYALQFTGYPIIQSCLSTLLGTVIVYFYPSYFFHNTSKCIALLLSFAVFHALFVIPVLFSVFSKIFGKRKVLHVTSTKNGPI